MVDHTKIHTAVSKIEDLLSEIKGHLISNMANTSSVIPTTDFDELKALLQSDKWPEAINPHLICDPNSETDKTDRAKGIIELMIEKNLKGLKLLDIGCAEGHIAILASTYGTTKSVGFDVQSSPNWDNCTDPNVVLTTDPNVVAANGPYDVIIIFDTLDHLNGITPTEFLKIAKSMLADNGKIYMRTHPFTSRHATHIYNDLNKAFIHLVFTPEELTSLVPNSVYKQDNIGSSTPLGSYQKMIEDAGLKSVSRREIKEKPEDFFKMPKIANRIMKNTGHESFPEFQMSLSFIDWELEK